MIEIRDYISGEVRAIEQNPIDINVAKEILAQMIQLSAKLNDGFDCVAVVAHNPEVMRELLTHVEELRKEQEHSHRVAVYHQAYAYYSWSRMNNGNKPISFNDYVRLVPENEAEHIAKLYHFV